MIQCQEWQEKYLFYIGPDPEKCRIIPKQHMQKLAEFIVRARFERIDDEILDEGEHRFFSYLVNYFLAHFFGLLPTLASL